MDEFEPLAGVEAPNDWIGGLLTVAVLFSPIGLWGES